MPIQMTNNSFYIANQLHIFMEESYKTIRLILDSNAHELKLIKNEIQIIKEMVKDLLWYKHDEAAAREETE